MVLAALVKGDRLMEEVACCKAFQNDNGQMKLDRVSPHTSM